jgi:hypothetical protein
MPGLAACRECCAAKSSLIRICSRRTTCDASPTLMSVSTQSACGGLPGLASGRDRLPGRCHCRELPDCRAPGRQAAVLIRVLPISGAAKSPFLGARALLTFDDLGPKPGPDPRFLRSIFSLTAAEAKLVARERGDAQGCRRATRDLARDRKQSAEGGVRQNRDASPARAGRAAVTVRSGFARLSRMPLTLPSLACGMFERHHLPQRLAAGQLRRATAVIVS